MGVLYPSYFLHLSARFKPLHVMMVFFPLLEFLPSCFQAENQIYKSKAMGERHGDWRAFKSFQSSQSFRERNKQEIKMELEMVAIPLFRGLKPGAFLNASSCFIFYSLGKGSSSPLLISLKKERNYSLWEILEMPKMQNRFFLSNCLCDFFYPETSEVEILSMYKTLQCQGTLSLELFPKWALSSGWTTVYAHLPVCFPEILLLNKVVGWPSGWTLFAWKHMIRQGAATTKKTNLHTLKKHWPHPWVSERPQFTTDSPNLR